jgi:hypothetical protein
MDAAQQAKLLEAACARHGTSPERLQAYSFNAKWVCIVLATGEKFADLVTELEAEAAAADQPPTVKASPKPQHTRKR